MELVDILRWTASISGMIAAAMVSLNAGARISGSGFVLFCGSSNIVLLGITLFGVYRYLWRKPKAKAAD